MLCCCVVVLLCCRVAVMPCCCAVLRGGLEEEDEEDEAGAALFNTRTQHCLMLGTTKRTQKGANADLRPTMWTMCGNKNSERTHVLLVFFAKRVTVGGRCLHHDIVENQLLFFHFWRNKQK